MTYPQQTRFAVFVLLILISSCAPKRAEIALDTKAIGVPALIALVEAGENKVKSLEGSGTVSFESPEIAGSAAFELSLKKPDSLLVLFEGPFGIDIGTLFLSREKYVVYNSFENRVIHRFWFSCFEFSSTRFRQVPLPRIEPSPVGF